MSDLTATRALIARDGVAAACVSGLPTLELLRAVADRVEAVVPYDSGAWCSLDPVTQAPTGSHLVGDLAEGRADDEPRPAQSRIRLLDGRWLVLRGTTLGREATGVRQSAVFLEPATGVHLAPLFVAMYELSSREQEVTELLLRGLTTDEIAARLFISRHTLRDHTKAIFAKVGVRSRPELTARFALEGPAAARR